MDGRVGGYMGGTVTVNGCMDGRVGGYMGGGMGGWACGRMVSSFFASWSDSIFTSFSGSLASSLSSPGAEEEQGEALACLLPAQRQPSTKATTAHTSPSNPPSHCDRS